MRDNLMFFNVKEEEGEDPEQLLKEFIREELKITRETEFARVHRTGRKGGRARPRPIVAKFERRRKTHWVETIKVCQRSKGQCLHHGYRGRYTIDQWTPDESQIANIGIGEQYPQEIYQRKKEQMPIFKNAVKNNQRVRFVLDKLYVNGILYNPDNKDSTDMHIDSA